MSDRSVAEKTRAFYKMYHFPGNRPIDQDGLILLRRFTATINRLEAAHPRRVLRVLDAGCGTGNTVVSLARRFPSVQFVGVDQSTESLVRAREAAGRHRLDNLQFGVHDLMARFPRGKRFDVILCLGVLHHTADMKTVLVNLRSLLRTDGELYLWIYGKHGRYRHSLNMRLLAELRTVGDRDTDPVQLASDLIHHSEENGVMSDLLQNIRPGALAQRAFDDPVWIADQFLNPHETLIEIRQLTRLVRSSGFLCHSYIGMDDAAAKRLLPAALEERFRLLSPARRLIALDLLLKPERYFVILRTSPSKGRR